MNAPSDFSPSWLFLISDVINFPPVRRNWYLVLYEKGVKKSLNVLISNPYNSNDQYHAEVLE